MGAEEPKQDMKRKILFLAKDGQGSESDLLVLLVGSKNFRFAYLFASAILYFQPRAACLSLVGHRYPPRERCREYDVRS